MDNTEMSCNSQKEKQPTVQQTHNKAWFSSLKLTIKSGGEQQKAAPFGAVFCFKQLYAVKTWTLVKNLV